MWQGKLLHIHTTPALRKPMIAQQSTQLLQGGKINVGDSIRPDNNKT